MGLMAGADGADGAVCNALAKSFSVAMAAQRGYDMAVAVKANQSPLRSGRAGEAATSAVDSKYRSGAALATALPLERALQKWICGIRSARRAPESRAIATVSAAAGDAG